MDESDLQKVADVIRQAGSPPDYIMFDDVESFERFREYAMDTATADPKKAPTEPARPNRLQRRAQAAESRRAAHLKPVSAVQRFNWPLRCSGCRRVTVARSGRPGIRDAFKCPNCAHTEPVLVSIQNYVNEPEIK